MDIEKLKQIRDVLAVIIKSTNVLDGNLLDDYRIAENLMKSYNLVAVSAHMQVRLAASAENPQLEAYGGDPTRGRSRRVVTLNH